MQERTSVRTGMILLFAFVSAAAITVMSAAGAHAAGQGPGVGSQEIPSALSAESIRAVGRFDFDRLTQFALNPNKHVNSKSMLMLPDTHSTLAVDTYYGINSACLYISFLNSVILRQNQQIIEQNRKTNETLAEIRTLLLDLRHGR